METRQTKAERKSLAIVASLFSIFAYLIYNANVFSGETNPNISSWLVWVFLACLNATNYRKLTGDFATSILPIVNSALCVITLVVAMIHWSGDFSSLSTLDYVCLALGIIAAIAWHKREEPDAAQVILQFALAIGFVPTFAGAWNSHSEYWLPWMLWTICFAMQFFVVQNKKGSRPIEYAYPVNMTLCHGIVFALCMF